MEPPDVVVWEEYVGELLLISLRLTVPVDEKQKDDYDDDPTTTRSDALDHAPAAGVPSNDKTNH